MNKKLLFLDTNILLDFYRLSTEANLSLLKRVAAVQDKLIMTCQVEMEFKKNRQRAILDSLKSLKTPDRVGCPGLFSDAAGVKALDKTINYAEKQVNQLKKRVRNALLKPNTHDPVFRLVQNFFTKADALNLLADSGLTSAIHRRAFRRFISGFPPRKPGDTSIGDAINWEWIIDCSQRSKADIIIVSRDSDYGATIEKEAFLNDWLLQEFRSRAGKRRKISLYTRLSEALKRFHVEVTEEERQEEEDISKRPALGISAPLPYFLQSTSEHNPYKSLLERLMADETIPGERTMSFSDLIENKNVAQEGQKPKEE
jgi:hypothetical protein